MMVRPYKLPELFGTPDWDKCLVDMDKIKPSGKYIPEDLDLSDVPDINSAEWDHIYDDLPEEDEPENRVKHLSQEYRSLSYRAKF